MDSKIVRKFQDADLIIYQRYGTLKARGFLPKYFEYDVKKNESTGRQFISRSQVVSYLKNLKKI